MSRIRCLGSRLCAAVTVTLIVMTAFGSAAFAQQAQTSVRRWTGRFEWTHVCAGPPGWGGKLRGIGDLALDYDGRANLTGTLAGTIPEGVPIAPTCSFKTLTPGTFSAKLVGSYTPVQNTFSAQATNVQTAPPQISITCEHTGSSKGPGTFYAAFQSPMFGDAFRDLRRQPDGSLRSNGERQTGTERSPCTTKYWLTLDGNNVDAPRPGPVQCRDPELSSGRFTRDPFGPETPADIAPSCESCAGGTWQLKTAQVTFHPTERKGIPQCVYTYESSWLCPRTGEVTKRTKTKITNEHCPPKG